MSKQFKIHRATRQQYREEAHIVLTESAKEHQKETATRPGRFPSTGKKQGEPAPPPDLKVQAVIAIATVMTTCQKQDRQTHLHLPRTEYVIGRPG